MHIFKSIEAAWEKFKQERHERKIISSAAEVLELHANENKGDEKHRIKARRKLGNKVYDGLLDSGENDIPEMERR